MSDHVVLLVDDDLTILTVLEWGLKAHFSLVTARDAKAALAQAAKHQLHAVVSDYLMPGDNGHWVLNEVAKMQPGCRRALMSSGKVPAAPHLVQQFFTKPVDLAALLAYLQL